MQGNRHKCWAIVWGKSARQKCVALVWGKSAGNCMGQLCRVLCGEFVQVLCGFLCWILGGSTLHKILHCETSTGLNLTNYTLF